MTELYKGMEGSPITYLAGDISAAQTTIAIADDTALPDAPNICTIGYGEHIETIRYGTKSNGVLQDVTRGIEGTPRAWQSGTEVARFFTAYDHNAIIEAHTSHLAESANKHIAESGSNENGHWTRFDNGLQICEGVLDFVGDFVVEPGTSQELTWTFPRGFIDAPSVIKDAKINTSQTTIALNYRVISRSRSSGHQAVILTHISRNSYSAGVYVYLTAIGRWK